MKLPSLHGLGLGITRVFKTFPLAIFNRYCINSCLRVRYLVDHHGLSALQPFTKIDLKSLNAKKGTFILMK